MKLACPSCFATLGVELSHIPPQGANVLCPNCGHTFFQPQYKPVTLAYGEVAKEPGASSHFQTPPLGKKASKTELMGIIQRQESILPENPGPPTAPFEDGPFEEYTTPRRSSALPLTEERVAVEAPVDADDPNAFFFDLETELSKPSPRELPLETETSFEANPSSEAWMPVLKLLDSASPTLTTPLPPPEAPLEVLDTSSPPFFPVEASPTELIPVPSIELPSLASMSAALETKPASPEKAGASQPPPSARLKPLGLLLGVCLLALGAGLYVVRPAFLFPRPPKPPPHPALAPLPSLQEMQAKLQEGSRRSLGEMASLPEMPRLGNVEQALLWCRSVFTLALLGEKPPQLPTALEWMATWPKETPTSVELFKTQAAYALVLKEAEKAIGVLEGLPEKDGESLWLLAQAAWGRGDIPQAVEVLHAEGAGGPRHHKTLGDMAFAQGDYAGAIAAYERAHAHPRWQADMELAIAKAWLHAHRPEKALERLSAWEERPLEEGMATRAWLLVAQAQLELELYAEAALTLEKLKTNKSLFAKPMAALFLATGNPKKAAALLEEEVKKNPEDFPLARQYAQALLLDNQAAEAENFVRRLLQTTPDDARAWLLGATVFQRLGQWESALAMVEKALLVEPQSIEAQLQWASIQQRLGKFSAAQSFLERATQESPDTAVLWAALGALFQEGNQLPKAKAAYAQALHKQPSNLEALTGLGRMALKEENMAELKKHVEKIEALNPRSPEGAWLAAHLLWAEGKKQEATEKLDWALRRDSLQVAFWLSKAQMAMEDKLWGRADEALARARNLSPFSASVNHWSGLLYEVQGDFKKAHSYFQKAAEADTQTPLYLLAQSRTLMSLHRHQEAAALLNRVMAQHPGNIEAPLLLGRYYQQRYRFKTALPLFEKSLAIAPNHVEALRGAAECLLELARWSQATAMLQRLLQQTPEDAGVMEKLGRAAFEAGHYAQAVQWYQKSLEREPNNPPALLNLGWAFKELGRRQEAIQAFRSHLQLEPLAPHRRMLEDEIRFLRQKY